MPAYTVDEAARRLKISKTALRGRIRRGSVVAHKDDSGIWLVEVDHTATQHMPPDVTQHTSTYDTSAPTSNPAKDMLLDALMSEVDFLRAQLERETVAHAQEVHELHAILADNRRALAATATTQTDPPRDEMPAEAEIPSLAHATSQRGTQRGVIDWLRQWLGK